MKTKVFGVGFHRTGTTSLQTALEHLGYSVVGMRDAEWDAYAAGEYDKLRLAIAEFDAFRDMPWPLLYKWLFEKFPDAKFILTYRDPEPWARSCSATYKNRSYDMISRIYGVEHFLGNEQKCIQRYERHIEEVREFFSDKPSSFLEIDFEAGKGWGDLCGFLNEPLPTRPFPHANNRPKSILEKIRYRLMKATMPSTYRRMVRDK